MAMGLGYLGMTVSTQGRYIEARHRLEDGLRGVRHCGDSRLVGWFLTNLGQVALAAGDLVGARRRFSRPSPGSVVSPTHWSEAWTLQGLAGVAIQDAASPTPSTSSFKACDRGPSPIPARNRIRARAARHRRLHHGTTRARRPALRRRQPRLAPHTRFAGPSNRNPSPE